MEAEPIPGSNKWETPFALVEIKDGIYFCTYKKGVSITLEDAKYLIKNRKIFTQNVAYPMLILDDGISFIAKEARDYMSKEGTEDVLAGAFVLKSVYSTFLINFYLSVTRPKVPNKMFTDPAKALEWLVQFKPKK
ncbi:MAG TPA: hypothetical protein VK806_12030 [Bacteroidia bacterium]|jgi:hypothetical protein|nr:hypothetical protein [Bacteroidia bacterium]